MREGERRREKVGEGEITVELEMADLMHAPVFVDLLPEGGLSLTTTRGPREVSV